MLLGFTLFFGVNLLGFTWKSQFHHNSVSQVFVTPLFVSIYGVLKSKKSKSNPKYSLGFIMVTKHP